MGLLKRQVEYRLEVPPTLCEDDARSAFASCGRAVAHVRGSHVPLPAVSRRSNAAPYTITSSAMASSVDGISRPSALAVLRLMTSSSSSELC